MTQRLLFYPRFWAFSIFINLTNDYTASLNRCRGTPGVDDAHTLYPVLTSVTVVHFKKIMLRSTPVDHFSRGHTCHIICRDKGHHASQGAIIKLPTLHVKSNHPKRRSSCTVG